MDSFSRTAATLLYSADEFPIMRWFKHVKGRLESAFFPEEHEVTADYWRWWKLRLGHVSSIITFPL
jgi:hypothetical protein